MARTTAEIRDAIRVERLVLAVKAAAAASVAWWLAPYVPYAASEYSYYAPLGVLITMYPTVAGSARAGMQTLVGLGLGIVFGLGGFGLVVAGAPAVVAIAIVIGVGILVSGLPKLGAGGDWVAMAGLFVLLLGGRDPDGFSVSYLLTMAFGVVVGLLANLVIIPPLYLRRASERLTALRDAVSAALRQVADAFEVTDAEALADSGNGLAEMLAEVTEQVDLGEESARVNPRGRRRVADRDLNSRRMEALARTTRATVDLAGVLVSAAEEGAASDPGTRDTLAAAVRASADLVAAPPGDAHAEERLSEASDALDHAVATLDQHPSPPDATAYSLAYAYAAAVCVRRIVDASRDFVATPGD